LDNILSPFFLELSLTPLFLRLLQTHQSAFYADSAAFIVLPCNSHRLNILIISKSLNPCSFVRLEGCTEGSSIFAIPNPWIS
jgi:hypothetical protein